jgi:PIN domain nuclease of toxin-antitoxin system
MPKKTSSKGFLVTESGAPLLLDTHIVVWLAEGNPRLKAPLVTLLKSGYGSDRLCLSVISAWEIGLLASKKRLDLGQPPLSWLHIVVQQFRINLLDITPEIAINSSYLPATLHGDPADRIIVATAITHGATIVSADKSIITYGKLGHVQTIAC